MSFVPPYRYVTATALASALKASPAAAASSSAAAAASSSSSAARRRPDIAIIDVRDDDFEGGNIVGAINVPSTSFEQRVHQLVEKELKDVPTVIFHCSLSQQRGPKSARIYSETRKAALEAGVIQALQQQDEDSARPALKPEGAEEGDEAEAAAARSRRAENGGQTILVLRDGFANFGRVYKGDKELVEGWDEEAWSWR